MVIVPLVPLLLWSPALELAAWLARWDLVDSLLTASAWAL